MGNGGCMSGGKRKSNLQLTENEVKFLTDNTHYTRDQILRWHQGFMADCPNGLLEKKKFMEVYKEYFPIGQADKLSQQVFSVFDTNKSGKIDFVEFVVAISTSASSDVRKKLRLAFNMYDKDKSGLLDRKEMEKLIVAIYDLMDIKNRKGQYAPKERVNAIFRALDKNYTNKIDCNEFVEGCLADPNLAKFLVPSHQQVQIQE